MNERKWVQHVSGVGEKWRVSEEESPTWMKSSCRPSNMEWLVCDKMYGVPSHLLPKSEYRLCEPPEQWEPIGEHVVLLEYVHTLAGEKLTGTFRVVLPVERKVTT